MTRRPRTVQFSQAIVVNHNEDEDFMSDSVYYQYVKTKWYTEAELTIIELENLKECREVGVSRGLELIFDDMCDRAVERRQRHHTQSVVAQQRQAQDKEVLRKFSRQISRASRIEAEERGAVDAVDVKGDVLRQQLDPSLNFGCFPARPTPLPGFRPSGAGTAA